MCVRDGMGKVMMPEHMYIHGTTHVIRISHVHIRIHVHSLSVCQDIAFCHMRIADGVTSQLQIDGLLARLCLHAEKFKSNPAEFGAGAGAGTS